ncbi:oligosaccharide flippase family protein [Patescibacteria group bacterium]|nr:oligosaccharide flippase family protein [Patescibacteria group bacterium]MBU1472160.1 oligosaccharide flippase family protein [Patescibacteria group bacterium]MBU2459554.1 oligosaccharide flippase family protein [Patescibacteria group bacterium]MBU2544205.1 oligosaccharide flippase family protein [Patescibacteria group bacterium]
MTYITQRAHNPRLPTVLGAYWKGGFIVLLAVVFGKSVSLLWKLLLARIGPQSLGTVEIALTVFTTLSSFSLLGLHTALMRFVTIHTAKKAHGQAQVLLWVSLKIATAIGLLLVMLFLKYPHILPSLIDSSAPLLESLLPYLWIIPLFAASELLWSFLAATKQMASYAIAKYVFQPAFRLFFITAAMIVGVGTSGILVPHLVYSGVASCVLSIALVIRRVNTRPSSTCTPTIKPFLLFALPMGGSFIAFVLYGALDVFLVGRYLGIAQVGLLSAVFIISGIPDAIYAPLLNIFQTYLGNTYTNIRQGFSFTVSNCMLFLVVGAITGAFVYLLRQGIVTYFMGPPYQTIVPLVGAFLLIKILQDAIVLPLRHFLDFYGYVHHTFVLMLISTLVKLIVGIRTVPAVGLTGVILMQTAGIIVHLAGCLLVTWIVVRSRKN